MPQTEKEKYKLFVHDHEHIPIFYQPWWLDLVCGPENWELAIAESKGGQIQGVFPYFRQKIKFIPIISNPVLTPYQGILLFYPENQNSITSTYSFENKVISTLISQLPKKELYLNISFYPKFKNWYPFYWRNFEQSTRYTYIIPELQDQHKVYSNFSNTLKRQIKKAEKDFKVVINDDFASLHKLFMKSMAKQKTKVKISPELIKNLYKAVKEKGQGKILLALNHQNKAAAAMMLVYDKKCAYCLVLGMNEDLGDNNAVKLLLWESIKTASKDVENYNFEGSMIPGVERVFRSFGGIRTSYYNISRYRNKSFKILFNLIKK